MAVADDVATVRLVSLWNLNPNIDVPIGGSVIHGNECVVIFPRRCIFLITTDTNEVNTITSFWGWQKRDEIDMYVFNVPVSGTVPLYRYKNDRLRDHLFTTDQKEGRIAAAQWDYTAEGICCYVSATQQPNTTPLWRLFHPESGIHYYTISVEERDLLQFGKNYKLEGTEGYVWTSPATLPAQ
ncbi:hypothetical protein AC630_33425 [Bradyrhizobium sp. AS23.2]|nr:hypothetical protein AC630_33425 [Bradyrhizobium sp. AS23.2]